MLLRRREMLLAGLGMLLAPRWSQAESAATALLSPFVERNELAGAVALVVDRNGVKSVDVVGKADRAAGRPMTRESLFWIASMTKPMTGVAVMMLVDEGKI